MSLYFNNIKYAIRQLRNNPGFTAVAIITLALCIGANLTIVAAVDSVLLRPLPFPDADRLVTMFNSYPKAGIDRGDSSIANYYERRGKISSFSHLSLFRYDKAIVGKTDTAVQEYVMRITPEFFETLGVPLHIGRVFNEEETSIESDKVIILTDASWRQRFNADPQVIGREIDVNGFRYSVVGVLPPSFRFLSSKARFFLPLSSRVEWRQPGWRHRSYAQHHMVARLKSDATLAEAQSQVNAHNAALEGQNATGGNSASISGYRTIVKSLHADHVRSIRSTLLLLQVGALFLLLIGVVNLINLLLVRASSRTKELSIRKTLGARRWHVVGQVITETILLVLIGGLAGLAVGALGIRLLSVLGANRLPLGADISVDRRLAMIALMGSIMTGVVIALPIAWFNLREHLADALQAQTRGGTVTRSAQLLRHGFLIAQIALSFVLLAGTGLLGLSLKQVMAVSTGFRPDHVLIGEISLPRQSYADGQARSLFTTRLVDEIKHLPSVQHVGVINQIPLSGTSERLAITIQGHTAQRKDPSPRAHYHFSVMGDYFKAMGITLLEGRYLDVSDSRSEELAACVIDEDFAYRYWPNGGAIGQRLFPGNRPQKDSTWYTIVGVVGVVKQDSLTEGRAQGTVYFPYERRSRDSLCVVVRTTVPPETLGSALRETVRSIDPALPLSNLRSMDTQIANSLMIRRSPVLLAGVFSGVALLLVAIGTYGVLSYAVAQRYREIGIRIALGAAPKQIGSHFLTMGLRLLVVGTILGVLGAWLAGRAMHSVLFNVPALPVSILIGTGVIMAVICLAACWFPVRRARVIDPMEALRYE